MSRDPKNVSLDRIAELLDAFIVDRIQELDTERELALTRNDTWLAARLQARIDYLRKMVSP